MLTTAAALLAFTVVFGAPLLASDDALNYNSTINLDGFTITFDENFDTLDVSSMGPGTRWIAHTPWSGDFGDAQFTDPTPDFPFTVKDGILRIEARKGEDGKWRSGLLASVDPNNNGFKQQYGYFEMRAKLPPGPGLWPAFWLDSMVPKGSTDPSLEVDVLEHYGHDSRFFESLVTIWPNVEPKKSTSNRKVHRIPAGLLYADFNTFGASVERDWTIIYLNRRELWRTQTPPEHRHPMMILLNLAMGSGWPIDKTPSPSYMYVDYVRAYQRK